MSNITYFKGNSKDLKSVITKAAGLVVVDFFADWCQPCKALGQVLPKLASDYPQVKFLKSNIDESPELADDFQVMSIPNVKFFKNNVHADPLQPVATVVGLNLGKIKSTLDEFQ